MLRAYYSLNPQKQPCKVGTTHLWIRIKNLGKLTTNSNITGI